MLKIEKANKFFNKGKNNEIHVINEMSLNMPETGLVAFLGPPGCGKTTLLNAVGGMDKLGGGSIYVDGQLINSAKTKTKVTDTIRALNIGYVFQDYKLLDDRTVYENIAITLRMIGIRDEAEIRRRVEYVLEAVNMSRYINRPADMLSGGERQRVGIARALAKNPKLILMDEPTGNLDSGNTIEVMNIVKNISQSRLVLLVTHEADIAKFYADRVVELKDGVVEKDYENNHEGGLDYRIANKFYLQDFEVQKKLVGENLSVNVYSEEDEPMDIDVVVKGGSIYIRTSAGRRIEQVTADSSIEFIDGHYQTIEKDDYTEKNFSLDEISGSAKPLKYSSVYSLRKSIISGFKKIKGFKLSRKLLLAGFVLTGVFITFAASSIFATITIQDKDFVKTNKNYVIMPVKKLTVEEYNDICDYKGVISVLPTDSQVSLSIDANDFYQTYGMQCAFGASLATTDLLDKGDVIEGKLPEKKHEIAIDKMCYQAMNTYGEATMTGISKAELLVGRTIEIPHAGTYKITAVVDCGSPSVYADNSQLLYILSNAHGNSDDDMMKSYIDEEGSSVIDYKLYEKDLTLKRGQWPDGRYEAIVDYDLAESYAIGSNLDEKVNGHKVEVVGYYTGGDTDKYQYLVGKKTVVANLLSDSSAITVAAKNKSKAVKHYRDMGYKARDSYEYDKAQYKSENRTALNASLILAGIMLLISLVEIVLMIRSSFMSRVKEVGILRAIGLKKWDIYKQFWGEIIAITTVSNVPGILIMAYILSRLASLSALESLLMMNWGIVILCLILVYLFNTVVGLIPVAATLVKKPAAILARQDVE